MNTKDRLGARGEQIAADHLTRSGWRILDRNWRCADGEIDIVAMDRRVLVVCEVKTRSGTGYGTPIEAISQQKWRRLRRLAVKWVVAHGLFVEQIRVDAIGVLRARDDSYSIEHVRGVG